MHPEDTTRRGRVLVVVNDETVIQTCLQALQDAYEVVTEARAHDAIEMLRAGAEFEVILFDVSNDELEVLQFHAAVWRLAPRMSDRIIFLVARQLGALASAFLESVPNARLEKPVATQRLLELINSRVNGGSR